ncbi:MAG TPA: AAA family ATPase [Verrucomicrobiae bacterium]|nr:AAA family ATPase [Verrucomicrobiae bacterium]
MSERPPPQQKKPGPAPLPAIEDVFDFINRDIPEPPQLIKGVLHKGCKMALGGGSKAYKSWMFIDLAVSVAYGLPWIGFETTQAKVCYLNFELPAFGFQQRVLRVMGAKDASKMNQPGPGWFQVWNLRGHSAGHKIIVPRLRDHLLSSGCGLIVLDPIYKLYGGADENSAGDISELQNSLEALSNETGAAIISASHFSKGNQANKKSIDRISGSGVFARDPDAIVTFTDLKADEDEDSFDKESFACEATLRNFPPVKPFAVTWEFPLMGRNDSLDPTKLEGQSGRPKTHTAGVILSLLPADGFTSTEWQKMALSEKEISRATFYRLRDELDKQGRVAKSKDDKWRPV